jgi:hypothetical protein
MGDLEKSGPVTRKVIREVYAGDEEALEDDPHFTKEKNQSIV